MKIKVSLVMALFAVSLLAACNTGSPSLPTVAPTIAGPTQAPITTTSAATAIATTTPVPAVRRTLPPTWTFTPEVTTEPPTPTQILPTSTPFVPQDLPPACSTFDLIYDQSTREFQLGTSPTVAWKPVEGAIRYNVQLNDANGRIVKNDIFIAETRYTFDASLFTQSSNVYTWSVYPINQAGDQMCFSVGDQMYPSLIALPTAG